MKRCRLCGRLIQSTTRACCACRREREGLEEIERELHLEEVRLGVVRPRRRRREKE